MSTESECLFELFCDSRGIDWRRVPESTEARPDYELRVAGQLVLAEVKQFDPNTGERVAIAREARGEQVVLGGTPGARLRRAIRAANTQLRELAADRGVATLLVVYNNTPCRLHTEEYAVATAMRGLDTVEVRVPADLAASPSFGRTRSGPRRMMRDDANTSTSAIAVLEQRGQHELELKVFHNPYASCPLAPEVLRSSRVRQFLFREDATNSLETPWREA